MSETTPNEPVVGAEKDTIEPAIAEPAPAEAKPGPHLKPTETVDFWKSKAREQETRAKSNFEDAQKWRELQEKNGPDFDPREEIAKLRRDIADERTERLRVDVARRKGIDPKRVLGATEDEMVESADDYLADINQRIESSKSKTAPAAAPAAEVTSDKKVEGPRQLTQDELKNLTPKQRIEAHRNGQLDSLMGNN